MVGFKYGMNIHVNWSLIILATFVGFSSHRQMSLLPINLKPKNSLESQLKQYRMLSVLVAFCMTLAYQLYLSLVLHSRMLVNSCMMDHNQLLCLHHRENTTQKTRRTLQRNSIFFMLRLLPGISLELAISVLRCF